MARMREIGASFDKGYRDDLNYNFGLLEALIGEANGLTDALRQEMLNNINNLQQQINILTGENIDELLARLNDSIQQALTAAQEARTAKTATEEATALATTATELAKASAFLADEKANYANEKAVLAQEAADNANQAASNLSQLKIDVVQATQGANEEANNANEKATLANNAADRANLAAENADKATSRASQAADAIEGWGTAEQWVNDKQYVRNNVVTDNGSTWQALRTNIGVTPVEGLDWTCLARKGLDGTGAVSSVNNRFPGSDGNVEVKWGDVPEKPTTFPPAAHTHEITDVTGLQKILDSKASEKNLNDLMNLSPSVLKIPLATKYRGWQGVTVYNNLIYVVTDRNEDFGLENIISVYSLDGKLVSEKRNAYTGLDPQGKFMSFGDVNEIDGLLYATVYNLNGEGSPLVSRVIKFDPETLDELSVHDIGGNAAESITKHNNSFWVVYHDIYTVRKFDLSFNLLQEYSLTMELGYNQGGPQGSLWEGDYFYVNLHGTNFIYEEPFTELRKYQFDGTDFNFVEKINPPINGCGQGLSKYGEYYFWNDRIRNHIVVSKKLDNGKVFPVTYHEGISFKPTLLSGWQGIGGDNNRSLRVTEVNNIIYLNGTLNNLNTGDWVYNGDGTNPICKIPPHLSPIYGFNFGALTNMGIIRISIVGPKTEYGILHPEKVGNINPQDISGLNQGGLIEWVSLDGISYPL